MNRTTAIFVASAAGILLGGTSCAGAGSSEAARAPSRDLASATLPAPTGAHAVATHRIVLVDSTRAETLVQDSDAFRTVVLRLWYPVEPSEARQHSRAPYVYDLDRLEELLSPEAADAFRSARPHAVARPAPRAPDVERPRVVLLSPAAGTMVAEYTSLAEDLASHGFVVVGVHPLHDAGPVAVPGGAVVDFSEAWALNDAGEVGPEAYLEFNEERVRTLAADARFVIDRLEELARDGGVLADVDLDNVAHVGHSVGGKAAVLACRLDDRVTACADLDGWPVDGRVEISGTGEPLLYLEEAPEPPTDAWLEQAGVDREQYRVSQAVLELRKALLFRRNDAPAHHARIAGTDHFSFTDRYVVRPEIAPATATADPVAVVEATRRLVRRFLTGVLGSDEESSTGDVLDVRITRYPGGRGAPVPSCTPDDPTAVLRLEGQMRAFQTLASFRSSIATGVDDGVGAAAAMDGRIVWSAPGGAPVARAAERLLADDGPGTLREMPGVAAVAADPATGLSIAAVVAEGSRERSVLEEKVGTTVRAVGRALSFCPTSSSR